MSTREMKDSGIEWIGEIPKDWEIERVKDIYSERTELSSSGTETLLSVSEYYGVADRSKHIDDGDFVSRAESLIGYKKCFKNDIVSNIMLAWKGSLGTTSLNGIVSPAYCVYKPKNNICSKFYHYLFRTDLYKSTFRLYSKGIIDSRLRLYTPYFFGINCIVPPYSEQQRIATFLDEKCKDIDTLITLQEEMIAELQAYKQSVISETVTKGLNPNVPMKDSGVEWIGEIPEHWEICRLKNKVSLNPNINSVLKNNDIVSFMPMQCLRNDIIIPQEAIYENVKNYTHFQNGDIVMAKVTPCFENGNIAIANNLVNDNGFGTSEIFVLRCSESYNKRYFFYYLQIPYIKGVGCASMTGTGGLKRVNPTILSTSKLLTPPLAEQHQIADYLDTKCAQIDELIALKQQKITELQDYKKSLIYEYVTGKKEVPVNH